MKLVLNVEVTIDLRSGTKTAQFVGVEESTVVFENSFTVTRKGSEPGNEQLENLAGTVWLVADRATEDDEERATFVPLLSIPSVLAAFTEALNTPPPPAAPADDPTNTTEEEV